MEDKFKLYLKEVPLTQDRYGFIYSDECDSLLFTSLVGCVPGTAVYIEAAFDKRDQQWKRRPIAMPACYPDHSKSSISRDMLIGLAWYTYTNDRLDLSEQVIRYALAHYFVMGQGPLSRTFMTPGLLSTYAWISYRLGGPSRPWLRYLPQIESNKVTDYQAHLSVLHILLRNKLMGKDKYADLLAFHANRNPENALFQFAAGRVDKAYTILNNRQYFPEDRLPRKSDRKGPWLWERDYGDNYQPTDSEKVLSGGDFLFVYALCKDLI